MSRFDFSLAAPADDDALRERLAADWIEGSAAISLRREPSYFAASRLQGTAVQVIIGRDRSSGRIALVASRAIGLAFAGGMPRRTACLADLRVAPEYRGGPVLARAFGFARELHQADPVPTITLIYDDNDKALRSLLGGRAGLPAYVPRGRMLAPPLRLGAHRARPCPGVELRRAHSDELPLLIRFVNRHRRARRWAPVLSQADFLPGGRCDTLRPEDFFVALRDGQPCATVAAWDQSRLRQVHVERYTRATTRLRPALNLFASLRGRPRLPAPGQPLPFVYLAFLAAEHDDAALARTLLHHACRSLRSGPWLYAVPAVHEDDPLAAALLDQPAPGPMLRLFEVDFDRRAEAPAPGDMPPHVELALT